MCANDVRMDVPPGLGRSPRHLLFIRLHVHPLGSDHVPSPVSGVGIMPKNRTDALYAFEKFLLQTWR